jgi:DsbC/DsbD-like thiol-disulfide interchange protein
VFLFLPAALAFPSDPGLKGHATLIADVTQAAPGSTFNLGIYLRPSKGWHTYWVNPGDSGGPTTFKLKLPHNWTQGPAIWPVPTKIDVAGIVSYGYKSAALLIVPIHVPTNPSEKGGTITGRVDWLTCTDQVCKPANQDVSFKIPIGNPSPSVYRNFFAKALLASPKTEPGAAVEALSGPQGVELRIAKWGRERPVADCYFFPAATGMLDHSKPEQFSVEGSTLVALLPKSPYAQSTPKEIAGVLVSKKSGQSEAMTIDVVVRKRGTK